LTKFALVVSGPGELADTPPFFGNLPIFPIPRVGTLGLLIRRVFMEVAGFESAHIYRPSKKAIMFFAVMGCLSVVAGIWLLSRCVPDCLIALSNESATHQPLMASSFMVVVGVFLVVSGVMQVRVYWKRILVLGPERVEVEFIYGLRSMEYAAIRGRRSRATQYGSCTVLVPKEKEQRKMMIKEGYLIDDYYRGWISSLPDLDVIDKENRRAAGKLHFWES
jgi:hypothetical protein